MAGFGLVLGGAADGFSKGVKLARDYEDTKRQQEIQQGQREAEAIMQGIPLPGQEIDPNKWTPEQVVNEAIEKAKPKPDPIQRMASAAMKVMRPRDAAMASGVTPPPAPAAAADASAPTAVGDGGAAGLPAKDVSPMTVTAAEPRALTDVERQRLMLAAASRLRGPEAAQKVQEAWTGLHAAEGEELNRDIAAAAFRGPDALANTVEKLTHHAVDLSPIDGQPGMYKVAIDGQDTGQPMTLAQMTDAAVSMAKRDPAYALQASVARNQDQRANREMLFNEKTQTARLAIQRQQAAGEALVQKATAGHLNSMTATEQAQLQQYNQEKSVMNDFSAKLFDQNGNGDALLNADQLSLVAKQAPLNWKGAMSTHMTTDPLTGQQTPVTTNNAQVLADAAIAQAKARYGASPYVKQGVLAIKKVQLPDGSARNFYTVKGVDNGAFTNIDAAEMAARRLYPKLEQQPKAAPKK